MKRALNWVGCLIFIWLSWVTFSILSVATQDGVSHSTDAIIVLGAGVDHDRPSPVLKGRLDSAFELFRAHPSSFMILTGGRGAADDLAESEVSRNYLEAIGFPADQILIETNSRTTLENLREAKALLDSHDLKNATILSDPLHLCRAGMMAADLGIPVELHPASASAFRTWKTKGPFLLRELYFYHHYLFLGQ